MRPLMIQGTMSGAGKSMITAGFCRIFRQDGYSAAPFKSQNMALNSFITRDGLEMGRAQVVQAEAAGKEPDVRMNPVLLKPSSDTGSQVIVNGEVRGFMSAAEYFSYKAELIPEIRRAFDSLSSENDVMVIEGAGSPAEINLRENDIVNMGLAEMVDAPVLLAGDIDRGGVFAQLYGTAELLTPSERARIKGFLINKFRGDVSLLKPGLRMLEEKTGIPVLGVIPYFQTRIDDEDSLASSLQKRETDSVIDIAVIRLPHISNFTDFAPLQLHPLLSVRYVSDREELRDPDLLILPGTKNTMDDLKWLWSTGLEAAIQRLSEKDTPILGICGGYQMLGKVIYDPEHLEGNLEKLHGLSLLPLETAFSPHKTRTRVTAEAAEGPFSGAFLEGYEIHMGESKVSGEPFCILEGGKAEGCISGNVFGTYLHGLFDTGELTERLASFLAKKKNLDPGKTVLKSKAEIMEEEYDRLADILRQSVDMEAVYEILKEG